MFFARACEFPNDNPLLHHGAVWVCATPCGPLKVLRVEPERRESDDGAAAAAADPPGVNQEPIEAPPCEATERAAPADPFSMVIDALVSVARATAAPRAADALPVLLASGRLPGDAIDAASRDALLAGGFVVENEEGGLGASDRLASAARAWRDALLGLGDFADCGEDTLNEWAAALLAALLGTPQRAQALQYELRRHGVAAFGVLPQAA